MTFILIAPEEHHERATAECGVRPPFELLVQSQRAQLEGEFGRGWYAAAEYEEAQVAGWLLGHTGAHAGADAAWIGGPCLRSDGWKSPRTRPAYAEIRVTQPGTELRRAPHEQPYVLRLARGGEAALELRQHCEVGRLKDLPPLAAALHACGWEHGLTRHSQLRRVAAAECALRGGVWLDNAGLCGLSEAERAAQLPMLWRSSPQRCAQLDPALEAAAHFAQDRMESALLQAGWDALLASITLDFQIAQKIERRGDKVGA